MDEMVEARAAEMTVEEAEAVIEEGTGEESEAVEEAPVEEALLKKRLKKPKNLLRKRLQKRQKHLLKKRPRHPLLKRGTRMSTLGLTTEVKRLGRSRPRRACSCSDLHNCGIAILVGGIYLDTLNGLMPLLGVFAR